MRTGSDRQRTAPPCPTWCTTSAADHASDDRGIRMHEGPAFGLVRTWWMEGPASTYSATVSEPTGGDLSSDELRQLAVALLDAATWMDHSERTTPRHPEVSVVELVRRAHGQATRTA